MDVKNLNNTPITNRGVETPITTHLSQISYIDKKDNSYLLVDWIQCTIFTDINIYTLFKKLFGINRENIILDNSALFGYNCCYSYKNIKIFENDSRDDMGIHLYITGSGCRDIEDLNISYSDLFNNLKIYGSKYTRLDISIDLFNSDLFTLNDISKSIKNKEVISRFKNSIEFVKTNLNDSKNSGYTIWFGSRASKIQIVFYDKFKERICQNYIINNDVKSWLRLECRFRDNYANEVIYNFDHINTYIYNIINNYISFKEYNPSDLKHKYRWKTKNWWLKFINTIDKIKFQNVNIESSITKKQRWLDDSVSRTNFIVFLSSLDNIVTDSVTSGYIYNFLIEGGKKITDSDIQFINDYRIKNNLMPLTRQNINDLIIDIKDNLIIKNK